MKRIPKYLVVALATIVLLSGSGIALSDSGWLGQEESTVDQQDQTALVDAQTSQQQDNTSDEADDEYGPSGDINLTEEQRTELEEMVEQMREDGANRSEIRQAVNAKLDAYGVEPTPTKHSKRSMGQDRPSMDMGDSKKHERAGFDERRNLSDDRRTKLCDTPQ